VKAVLNGHTAAVLKVIQLRDGRLVSSAGDFMIHIWNLEDKKIEETLKGHTDKIWSLAELRDGRLESGSNDKKIKIWNLTSC